jgi:hypothetical protein
MPFHVAFFLVIPFLLLCVYLRLSAAKGFAFFMSHLRTEEAREKAGLQRA